MLFDPPNGDIVPCPRFWIVLYFFSEKLFRLCEFNNIIVLEQGFPGVDGRHSMEELLVELARHDDGVTWVLVEQGFGGSML